MLVTSHYGLSSDCQLLASKVYSQEHVTFLLTEESDLQEVSLYELLVELFGERLLLKLEKKFETTNQVNGKRPCQIPSSQNRSLQNLINQSFSTQQKREGFTSLHHLINSQRLVPRQKSIPMAVHFNLCLPFCIKKYRLPVSHNVFELRHHTGSSHSHSTVVKKGYKRTVHRNLYCVCDVCCWL